MTNPSPADVPEAYPPSTRRVLEEFVTQFARRIAQDDEPDLDAIDTLTRLTASVAELIDARTRSLALRRKLDLL